MNHICVTGTFQGLCLLDPYTLQEVPDSRIGHPLIRPRSGARCVQVFDEDDYLDDTLVRPLVAVGDGTTYGETVVIDIARRRKVSTLPTFGLALESIPASYCSDFAMVVAGNLDGIFVCRALSGHKVFIFPNAPKRSSRILCEPAWSSSDVYVAGSASLIARYDLNWTGDRIGSYLRLSTRCGSYRAERVASRSSYGSDVTGLATDVARKVLFSSSNDNCVRMFSRDDYSCESEITLAGPGRSLFYAPDLNSLIVGEINGLEFFDPRQTGRAVTSLDRVRSSSHIRDEGFNDIDRVSDDTFVCVSGSPAKAHLIRWGGASLSDDGDFVRIVAESSEGSLAGHQRAYSGFDCLGCRFLRKSHLDASEMVRIAGEDSCRLEFAMGMRRSGGASIISVSCLVGVSSPLDCWQSLLVVLGVCL